MRPKHFTQERWDYNRLNAPVLSHYERKLARYPNDLVEKGQYYYRIFRSDGRRDSLTEPKRWELCLDDYWAVALRLEEDFDWDPDGDFLTQWDEYISDLRILLFNIEDEIRGLEDGRRGTPIHQLLITRRLSVEEWIDGAETIMERYLDQISSGDPEIQEIAKPFAIADMQELRLEDERHP